MFYPESQTGAGGTTIHSAQNNDHELDSPPTSPSNNGGTTNQNAPSRITPNYANGAVVDTQLFSALSALQESMAVRNSGPRGVNSNNSNPPTTTTDPNSGLNSFLSARRHHRRVRISHIPEDESKVENGE